jgi:hypothetical protein
MITDFSIVTKYSLVDKYGPDASMFKFKMSSKSVIKEQIIWGWSIHRRSWNIFLINHQIDGQIFHFNNITFLYMFRAILRSSSGSQDVNAQHLVGLFSVGGWPVHRAVLSLPVHKPATYRHWPHQMLCLYNLTSWGWA